MSDSQVKEYITILLENGIDGAVNDIEDYFKNGPDQSSSRLELLDSYYLARNALELWKNLSK
jgi:hypothetical protein